MANHLDSDQAFSGVGQTANLGSSTSVSSGAAKIFREFKWGLLTLFILMAVVVGLVYDGGRAKKTDAAARGGESRMQAGLGGFESLTRGSENDNAGAGGGAAAPVGGGVTPGTSLGGSGNSVLGPSDRLGSIPSTGRPNVTLLDDSREPWNPEPLPNEQIRRGANNPAAGQRSRNEARADSRDLLSNDDAQRQPRNDERMIRELGTRDTNGTRSRPVETRAGEPHMYVVKSGDSLSRIAATNNLGKNGIKQLLDANKEALAHPDRLREGMKLRIPGPATATPARAETAQLVAGGHSHAGDTVETHGTTRASADTYTVQAGDSLERIARKVLNDARKWKDLLEWNKDRLSDPTKLKVGMVLRVHGVAGTATSIPAVDEAPVRYQNNTVRAQHEVPAEEQQIVPENENEGRIPVSPVSASRKVHYPAKKEKPQIPVPDELPPVPAIN